MTHEELLHIAQAFAYLELKIDKIVPDSPDRSAAISLLEQAADHIMRAAAADRVKVDTEVDTALFQKTLRICR